MNNYVSIVLSVMCVAGHFTVHIYFHSTTLHDGITATMGLMQQRSLPCFRPSRVTAPWGVPVSANNGTVSSRKGPAGCRRAAAMDGYIHGAATLLLFVWGRPKLWWSRRRTVPSSTTRRGNGGWGAQTWGIVFTGVVPPSSNTCTSSFCIKSIFQKIDQLYRKEYRHIWHQIGIFWNFISKRI